MFRPLSIYARKLLADRAELIASLQSPVLVWEGGTLAPGAGSDELFTEGGSEPVKPTRDNPIVFEVTSEDADFGHTVAVGRSQSNDVVIENPSVSRLHALIHWDERERHWQITDAGSRNGMHVDGVYIPREQAAFVRDGATIILGDVRLLFLVPLSFVAYIEGRAQPPPAS
jgi:hypothetical protein